MGTKALRLTEKVSARNGSGRSGGRAARRSGGLGPTRSGFHCSALLGKARQSGLNFGVGQRAALPVVAPTVGLRNCLSQRHVGAVQPGRAQLLQIGQGAGFTMAAAVSCPFRFVVPKGCRMAAVQAIRAVCAENVQVPPFRSMSAGHPPEPLRVLNAQKARQKACGASRSI